MIGNELEGSAPDARYERLSRLADRYEQGDLSDIDFQQLKQRILLETAKGSPADPPFELVVATYGDIQALRADVATLQTASREHRAAVIDAIVVTYDAPALAQVRTLETLTRKVGRSGMSISGFVCGMVYAPAVLRPPPDCREIAASFTAAGESSVWSKDLQALDKTLGPGTRAIITVAWRRAADPVAACLQNYDSVVRIVLAAPVANAILRFMFAELEG